MKQFTLPAVALLAVIALGSAAFVATRYMSSNNLVAAVASYIWGSLPDGFEAADAKNGMRGVVTVKVVNHKLMACCGYSQYINPSNKYDVVAFPLSPTLQTKFATGSNGDPMLKEVPLCGPNQYFDIYGVASGATSTRGSINTTARCVTISTTTSKQVDDIAMSWATTTVSSDPYCPPKTTTLIGHTGPSATALGADSNCIVGEASRIPNYVTP